MNISARSWSRWTALLVVGLTVQRAVIATRTGLSDTEAYYAQWARFPSLSYYDHPPLVAWTTWMANHLAPNAWSVRLGPVVYAAIFDALVFRLATRIFSPRAGFLAVSVLAALPAFVFTGFLLNPEGLLAPLWVSFLILLLGMRRDDAAWRPLALGAVVGVAFLAKYTAILAVPVALLTLAVTPDMRRWLRRPSLYGGGLVALALTTPVLLWNVAHGWPSLHLHLAERMGRPAGEALVTGVWRVMRGQLLDYQPVLWPTLIAVSGITLARSRGDERYRFLAATSLPVLGFLLAMMLRAGDSEPHWTMMGYLPLVVAFGGLLDETVGALRRWATGVFWVGEGVSLVVAVLYVVHLCTPALAKQVRGYDPYADPLAETLGWDRVRATIDDEARALGPGTVVLGAHNVLCGHVQAVLDDSPAVYCASPRRTEYDFIGRRTPPIASPVVFVDSDRYPSEAASLVPGHACGAPRYVNVDRSGLRQARYRIVACTPTPRPLEDT